MNYSNEEGKSVQMYKLVPITKEEAARLPMDQILDDAINVRYWCR